MAVVEICFYIVIAYLLGAIPVGLLIGIILGKDIRKSGSGNIGATNTFRTVGPLAGIVTLLLDGLKGAVPVLLFPALLRYSGIAPETTGVLFGIAAFCGHVWPVYLRFKGGKGVATALGVLLALAPYAVLTAFAAAVLTIALSRMVSLGSLLGTIVFLSSYWLYYSDPQIYSGAVFIAFIIIIRHKANIQRLLKGKENRL